MSRGLSHSPQASCVVYTLVPSRLLCCIVLWLLCIFSNLHQFESYSTAEGRGRRMGHVVHLKKPTPTIHGQSKIVGDK